MAGPGMLGFVAALLLFVELVAGGAVSQRAILQRQNKAWGYPLAWNGTNKCVWQGVMCNAKRDVTSLYLYGAGVSGTLVSDLGGLTALTFIDMNQNFLTGAIPRSIGDLTALRYLDLGNNLFTAPIPDTISKLTKLTRLNFGTNRITGTLPKNITKLVKLKQLYLDNNFLTGAIPFVKATLDSVYVYNNYFNGKVPSFICNSTDNRVEGNCFKSAPSGCYLDNKTPETCSAFCGLTSGKPACSGLGTCSGDTSVGFTCSGPPPPLRPPPPV